MANPQETRRNTKITVTRREAGITATAAILAATTVGLIGYELGRGNSDQSTAAATAAIVEPGTMPSSSPVGGVDIKVTPKPTEAVGTPRPVESQAPASPDNLVDNNEMGSDGGIIPVLSNVKQLQAFEPGSAPQGRWFNPIYDPFEADAAHDWRGIGPWYPVAVMNLDANAATFTTHGNPGELIVQANQGGRVEVAFWQIDAYQNDGSWGHNASGRLVHNPDWDMQYTFKGVPLGTEMHIVDADTGNVLAWPDGTPVIYLPSEKGDASFAIPETNGNDVRWGVVFEMSPAVAGEQKHEIKIERGPNDRPELKGENPLPEGVIKPMVPGAGK